MNAAVAKVPSGLVAAATRQPIPLEGVDVHATIRGIAARVTLRQRFRNAEEAPIDAVYVFPAPEGAAICGMEVEVGERRIVAVAEEREKAFAEYDDALAAGHGAVLLDQERPNVFTLSVGNLLPGQTLTTALTWVERLPREGDALRFLLPTTVSPRYAPAEDRRGVSPTPAERVSPPYGFTFAADIELPGGVAAVDSPTHPVQVTLGEHSVHVELASERPAMDRDLVLRLTPRMPHAPWGQLERQKDGRLVAVVSFVPRFEARPGPREVVFLLDRSRSMLGGSIHAVRNAVQLCLRSLQAGDRLQIIGFGSTFEKLFEAPRPYDDDTLAAASAAVARMDADLGGTEILPALRAALSSATGALPCEVLLLTDGQVTNEDAVIDLARAHAATCRIFAFGIGHGASEHLVRALARVSGGTAEMIVPGERLEGKVLRQFHRLRSPRLHDIRVDWNGAEAELQAPHRPGAVFEGEAVEIAAWLTGRVPETVRLLARGPEGPLAWEVPLPHDRIEADTLLGTLAARTAIRDLEEGTSALHERRGSRQRERTERRIRDSIVTLAKAYRLTSSATSLVAVETRPAATAGAPAQLRRVPVALTAGWGGVHEYLQQRAAAPVLVPPPAGPFFGTRGCYVCQELPDYHHDIHEPGNELLGFSVRQAPPHTSARAIGRPGDAPAAAPVATRTIPDHVCLALLQNSDGSWRLDESLADVVGISLMRLEWVARVYRLGKQGKAIVATTAALLVLRTRCQAFEDKWRAIADQAETWLATALQKAGLSQRKRKTIDRFLMRALR